MDKDCIESDKAWDAKYMPLAVIDLQSPVPKHPEKRSNNSLIHSSVDNISSSSVEKGKLPRTDTRLATTNGTWLKKRYLTNACYNHASCSVRNSNSQASGENTPLSCLRFQSYQSRKKSLSRKDSLNVNISSRKDGQVIIGR